MHGRSELGPQYLYLSTPEQDPFPITIRDGGGNVLGTVVISNALPGRWSIGSSGNTAVMVLESDLHKPLQNKGLVLVGEKKFYVNFRFHSDSQFQAADLTCKGRSALGTAFRIGHVFQSYSSNSQRCNFVGVMATEDSTVVTLSDFDPGTDFQIGGVLTAVSGPQTITLQAGETVVFGHYVGASSSQPPNGLIGSKVISTKPVAINCGSWTGSPVDNSNDVGLDQIAPFDQVGQEYILCEGNGSDELETPLVIAHVDNTSVWLNGETSPTVVLNAGEYYRIPTSRYSSAGNMYILCSQPTFVYQIIGGVPSGDDAKRTAGLIFVPPISCAIPNAVNNIYQPNQIGVVTYDGGLMIVAMKDSTVEVRVNNTLVALGAADAVMGNPDFVTYRRLSLFSESNPINTTSVIAKGAVQVAMFGRNGAAGFGAFYSGFSKTAKADISLRIIGDGVCPDTLVASGRFDGVQWYYADSLLTYGPDSFFVAYAPGLYTARGYLGVCRRADFAEDTTTAVFNSPVFPYSTVDPSCYDYSDGQILFGTPMGGLAPYQYSVNQGQSFSQNSSAQGLHAGTYQLVVRDVTGCYNRPLEVSIGQPDSLSVQLNIVKIDEPVKIGDYVLLDATPSRSVEDVQWLPAGKGIPNFLRFTATPTETTNFSVVVTDAAGCTATDMVRIILEPSIFAPNIFSPTSSNGNERFTLFSKDNLPVNWLRIYDRWGELVFENRGFLTNDLASGWDGSFRGSPLTPSVFVFMAEVEYEPGLLVRLQGDITLLR
jgi:gliding motility-associated-like protein